MDAARRRLERHFSDGLNSDRGGSNCRRHYRDGFKRLRPVGGADAHGDAYQHTVGTGWYYRLCCALCRNNAGVRRDTGFLCNILRMDDARRLVRDIGNILAEHGAGYRRGKRLHHRDGQQRLRYKRGEHFGSGSSNNASATRRHHRPGHTLPRHGGNVRHRGSDRCDILHVESSERLERHKHRLLHRGHARRYGNRERDGGERLRSIRSAHACGCGIAAAGRTNRHNRADDGMRRHDQWL